MCAARKTYSRLWRFVIPVMLTAISLPVTASAESKPYEAPWLRIEQLDARRSVVENYAQLTFHATAVNLQGVFLKDIVGKQAWTLTIGKQKKKLPYIAGQFHALPDELAIAIVIDTSAEFGDILPTIQQETVKFIEGLPKKRTQVAIIGFDDKVHGSKRVRSTSRAISAVQKLYAYEDPADKRLLDAIKRAQRALDRAKPQTEGAKIRGLIVVVSDGRDETYPRPEKYRKIAKKAKRAGYPIHTIAWAPDGNRLPLRGLGELSRRSGGTFRFAYIKNGFAGHYKQLSTEILDRYTVTFFVPEKDIKGKRVGLLASAKDLSSTEQIRVTKLDCGGKDACEGGHYCAVDRCVTKQRDAGRGILGWILLIGGIVVGGLIALVLLGFIISAIGRRRSQAPPPDFPPDGEFQPPPEEPEGPQRVVGMGPGMHLGQAGPQGGRAPSAGGHPGMPPTGSQQVLPTGSQRVLPTGAHGAMPPTGSQRVLPTGAHGAAGRGAAPAPGPRPVLLILEGPYQNQRIPLHNGFTIGKAPDCHLTLANDNFASGHHARVILDTRGTCTLVDQGSTNGTYINGVRVTQKQLSHGMLVGIGSMKARFLTQ